MTQAWHQKFKRRPAEDRTSPDGILHASMAEKDRWCQLQLLERHGKVRHLQRQVKYTLACGDIEIKTPTGKVMVYKPDFVYERPPHDTTGFYPGTRISADGWYEVIEDHKGFQDRIAELRIAVFEGLHKRKVHIHKC